MKHHVHSLTALRLSALLPLAALALIAAAGGPVRAAANGAAAPAAEPPAPVVSMDDALGELAGTVADLGAAGDEFVLASSRPAGPLQGYVLCMLEVHLRELGCRLRPLGRRLPVAAPGNGRSQNRNGANGPPEELPEPALRQLRAQGTDLLVLADPTTVRGQRYLRVCVYGLRDGRQRLLLKVPFHLTDPLAPLATGKAGRMDRADRLWLELFDHAFPPGERARDTEARVQTAAADYAFASGLWTMAAPMLMDAATDGDRMLARAIMARQLGGDADAATAALAAALKQHPGNGPLWALRAWVSLRQGDDQNAPLWLEQARFSDMTREGLYLYARGLIALEQKDETTARTELTEAADLATDVMFVQRELARFHRNRAELDQAIEYYRRAVASPGAAATTWAEMAIAMEAAGRTDEAVQALQTAFAMRSDSLAIARHLSRLLRRTARHEDALNVMRRATEADPFDAPLLTAYGDAALAMWRTDDAERAYRAAADADAGFHLAGVRLASLLARRGEYKAARALLTGLLAVAPEHHPARVELALIMSELGHHEEALAALQDAMTSPGHEVAVQLAIAQVHLNAGKPEAAVAAAQIAAASRPSAATYSALTRAFLVAGQADKAQAAVDAALLSDPSSAEATVAAARVALAKGDPQEAHAQVARVLQIDPYNAPGHELDGELWYEAEDFRRCAESWRRALALDPWNAELHRDIRDVLGEKLGDWDASRGHNDRYAELAAQKAEAAG